MDKIIAVVIGAVISGLITNADRLLELYDKRKFPDSQLCGTWYGSFRELGAGDSIHVNHATVTFEPSKEGQPIRGIHSVTHQKGRVWQFRGEHREQVFIATYFGRSGGRAGGVALVLRGDPGCGALKGYWIGTDPEHEGRIARGPYVLTTNRDMKEVEAKHATWLTQDVLLAPKDE